MSNFSQIEKRKKIATVYLPEDWFRVVREANKRKPLVVSKMKNKHFRDCKSYISGRYRPFSKDNHVMLGDTHWLNFRWGEDLDPRTARKKMCHHPNEVWVCHGFSKDKGRKLRWKKVKMVHNPRLPTGTPDLYYDTAIKVAPAKVKDLKDMASRFVPEPQCQFYLQMDGGEEEDLSLEENKDA